MRHADAATHDAEPRHPLVAIHDTYPRYLWLALHAARQQLIAVLKTNQIELARDYLSRAFSSRVDSTRDTGTVTQLDTHHPPKAELCLSSVPFLTFYVFLSRPVAPFTRLHCVFWFCFTARLFDRSVYLNRLCPLRLSSTQPLIRFFRLGRKRLSGHRGKRMGEASNPGPPKVTRVPKTSSQTSATTATSRWRQRPSEVECQDLPSAPHRIGGQGMGL